MFPARVGRNLLRFQIAKPQIHVPRACGDEPAGPNWILNPVGYEVRRNETATHLGGFLRYGGILATCCPTPCGWRARCRHSQQGHGKPEGTGFSGAGSLCLDGRKPTVLNILTFSTNAGSLPHHVLMRVTASHDCLKSCTKMLLDNI